MRVYGYSFEPLRERVKVSHVKVECRVINHHPIQIPIAYQTPAGKIFQSNAVQRS